MIGRIKGSIGVPLTARNLLSGLFGPSPAAQAADRIYTATVAASRRPGFFGAGRIPDTLDGRIELLTLHASLALIRLKHEPHLSGLTQTFANKLFRGLDEGLREAGVGDLSVPKKMQALAGRFYGRLNAYEAALASPGEAALVEALKRNIWADPPLGFPEALAAYALQAHAALGAVGPQALESGAAWPAPPA
jgi:cytochrome b pre-mRNA-processing protein 3